MGFANAHLKSFFFFLYKKSLVSGMNSMISSLFSIYQKSLDSFATLSIQ